MNKKTATALSLASVLGVSAAVGAGTYAAFSDTETLSPRERDVLAALIEGQAAAAIAKATFVSEATVRTQIRSLLAKLGVNSQLEAVAAARRVGWDPAA